MNFLVVERVMVVTAPSTDVALETVSSQTGIPVEKLAATDLDKVSVVWRGPRGEEVLTGSFHIASPKDFLAE